MTWQPIETAPRDGTPVDLWHRAGFRMTEAWWDDDDQCWSSVNDAADFTHWMPLPPPPGTVSSVNPFTDPEVQRLHRALIEATLRADDSGEFIDYGDRDRISMELDARIAHLMLDAAAKMAQNDVTP